MKCDILLVKMRSNDIVNDIMIAPYYSYIKEGDIVTNEGGVDYVVHHIIDGYDSERYSAENIQNLIEWSTMLKLEDIQKVCGHYSKKEIKVEDEEEERGDDLSTK